MIDTSPTTDSTTENVNSQTAECLAGEVRFVGYARVSTDDQNLSLQIDALTKHGIPRSNIFMDKISGVKNDRPGLAKCLNTLQRGDVLVVWRLDRLGRSMRHLINLVEDLRSRGVGFRSLNEGAIDTTNATTFDIGIRGQTGGRVTTAGLNGNPPVDKFRTALGEW